MIYSDEIITLHSISSGSPENIVSHELPFEKVGLKADILASNEADITMTTKETIQNYVQLDIFSCLKEGV